MNIAGLKSQFEDGGRDESCNKYWCDICKVVCSSALNLQVHIRGYQHRKVEQILKETLGNKVDNPLTPEMNSGDARSLEEYIMTWNVDEPLIGLNYVIEYQRDGGREPMYECTLCDFTGYMRIFVLHLAGFKHRMNYMSKEYPEMMKWDGTKLKPAELTDIVKERAAIIEKLEGRRSIQVVRGQDPPSTIGIVKRVPLPSLQQEWEINPSKVGQNLMEGLMNPREQSERSEMMYSAPRDDDGQYGADVRISDMYADWRKDNKDAYGELVGAKERYADLRKDNRTQYEENISRGYTDWSRDNKEQYVDATVSYDQYSDQRKDNAGGPYGDRVQDSAGYADWRKVHQEESENDIRGSDRYLNIRKDDQPQYIDDGRGADWRRDDRKQFEDEYTAREQTGKSDRWMELKGDYSQPQSFSDVIDLKRKKLYDYLQKFQIKSEDDASFVLKVTKAFKDALISYYQKKETDPAMRATLDQRTARSTGIPDDYSRYNPDVSASAVPHSESLRGGYDWKQDTLAPNLRQSFDSTSYLSSTTPVRDSALYSSSSRGYSSDYKSSIQDVNWGPNTNTNNTYYGR
uniref:uncharacterized protein isoform X2 n=1 Tax=Pristiophorus japonicus TaxID=55135 RepID=UPI00398E65F2